MPQVVEFESLGSADLIVDAIYEGKSQLASDRSPPLFRAITAFRGPIEGRSPLPATRRTIPSRNSVVQLAGLVRTTIPLGVWDRLCIGIGGHFGPCWLDGNSIQILTIEEARNNFINISSPFVPSLTIF